MCEIGIPVGEFLAESWILLRGILAIVGGLVVAWIIYIEICKIWESGK